MAPGTFGNMYAPNTPGTSTQSRHLGAGTHGMRVHKVTRALTVSGWHAVLPMAMHTLPIHSAAALTQCISQALAASQIHFHVLHHRTIT